MANSLAVEAISAQKLWGYQGPLSQISSTGQYKVEQSQTDGSVYASVNGGPWVEILDSGGLVVTVSLDAAYQGGNQINLTQARGAVILSSARTSGSILNIVTTNAPATVTAQLAAISIDMSTLGTAATPSTFDLPAITIVGARSSVAKAAGKALVQITSSYRNATAVSVRIRNKQAVFGSAVIVGWDTENYEGAAATSSILTGQTCVVTIDGQANVDAATNNVEFVGLRILVPLTSSASARGIVVGTLQSAGVIQSIAYSGATTLAGTSTGLSIDMATNVTPGAQLVTGISITIPATTAADGNGQGALIITNNATSARIIDLNVGNTSGNLIHIRYPNSKTLAGTLIAIQAPLDSNVTGNNQTVYGINMALPTGISSSSCAFRGSVANAAGTTEGIFHAFYHTATTLTGPTTGMVIDLSTNVTPGANAITGISITIPASSSASTTGLTISSTQTSTGSGISVSMTPGSSSGLFGMSVTVGANGSSASACIKLTMSGAGAGIYFASADGGAGHIAGPNNATLIMRATNPTQASGSTAGNAVSVRGSDATAGSSSAGAAAGGSVTVQGGDAKRLTSGNAAGGSINLSEGAGIGTGARGTVAIGSATTAVLQFFGSGAGATQQTSGENLTNNVTAGGVDGTIADFTSLTVYATDAATIRNDIYQLARKLKQVNDGLRAYGMFT